MEEIQGSRHFQISKGISTDMTAGPAGWTLQTRRLLWSFIPFD